MRGLFISSHLPSGTVYVVVSLDVNSHTFA
jgi:hypothetical protein